jgi:hypothetical protein
MEEADHAYSGLEAGCLGLLFKRDALRRERATRKRPRRQRKSKNLGGVGFER